jgi:hypothetical protein
VVSIKPFRESQDHKNDSCDHRPGEQEARDKAFVTLGENRRPSAPRTSFRVREPCPSLVPITCLFVHRRP